MPHTKDGKDDTDKKKPKPKSDKKQRKKEEKERRKSKKLAILGPREKVLKLNKDGKWQLSIAELRLDGKSTAEDTEHHSGSFAPPVLALYDINDTTQVLKKIPVKSIRESTYTGSRFTQGVSMPIQSPEASQTPAAQSSSSSTYLAVDSTVHQQQQQQQQQQNKGKRPISTELPTNVGSPMVHPAHNSSIYYAVMSTKNKEYIFSLDYNRDIILANYDDSDAEKKSRLREDFAKIDKNFFDPLFERVSLINSRVKKSMSRLRLSSHFDPVSTYSSSTSSLHQGQQQQQQQQQTMVAPPQTTATTDHHHHHPTATGATPRPVTSKSLSFSAVATANITAIPDDKDADNSNGNAINASNDSDNGDDIAVTTTTSSKRKGDTVALQLSSPHANNHGHSQTQQSSLTRSQGLDDFDVGQNQQLETLSMQHKSVSMSSLPVLVAGDLEKWHAEHGEESIERSVVERGDPKKVAKKKMRSARKARARVSKPPTQMQFKVNVQGEVVYKKHPSWLLMHQMQIGIRYCIGKEYITQQNTLLLSQPQYWKRPEFFTTPLIYRFPEIGAPDMATHTMGDFKFKDYCPLAFRYIRALFGVDRMDFIASLCHSNDFGENALRLMTTPGKSGSLFFFSQDMRYIIKTIPKREARLLRSILPPYIEHITRNPETLLPRFYGLYRVKPHHGNQVRFVITNNLFATPMKVHERFDLKGSFLGRFVTPEEQAAKGGNATLKEKNWVLMKKKVHVGPTVAKKLLAQIKEDIMMLSELGIMDYSLLVGIHYENLNEANVPFDLLKSTSSTSVPDSKKAVSSTPLKSPKSKDRHHHHHHHKSTDHHEHKSDDEETKKKDAVSNEDHDDGGSRLETDSDGDEKDEKEVKKKKSDKKGTKSSKKITKSRAKSKEELKEEKDVYSNDKDGNDSGTALDTSVPQYATFPEVDMGPGVDPEMPEFLMSIDMQPQSGSVQVIETEEDGEVSIVSLPYSDEFAVTGYESMLPKAKGRAPWYECNGGMQARDENDKPMQIYYFVGIIDILMFYTARKVAERIYKKIWYYGQGEVSSCPPPDYAKRFYEFIKRYIE